MKEMENFLPLIEKIADELDEAFWDRWYEESNKFPDTEDALKVEVVILEVTLLTIIGNFLTSFKGEFRKEFMERLISNIRLCENLLPLKFNDN